MQIGIFPGNTARGNDLNFLVSILESHQARELGIGIVLLESVADLENFRGDSVHVLLAGGLPSGTDQTLERLNVPYLCSVSAMVPELFHRHRLIRAGILQSDLESYPRLLARARKILVHSPGGAWLLEHYFGFPSTAVPLSLFPFEEQMERNHPRSFKLHDGFGPFILAYAGEYSPYSNIHRLLPALDRINIASVIVGRRSDSDYSLNCKKLALGNPRLRIVDMDDQSPGVFRSALSACEVFVDPTAYGVWNAVAATALALRKRSVVSSKARLESWFGDSVEYAEPTSPELLHHGIVTALNKGSLSADPLLSPFPHSSTEFLGNLVSVYSQALTSV